MVFGMLLEFIVTRSGEVFLKKVGCEQILNDWQDLGMNMEGIIGEEENNLTDMGMRKHVYGPIRKMTLLKNLNYNKIALLGGAQTEEFRFPNCNFVVYHQN